MDLLAELRGLFNAPTMTDQQALERVRTLSLLSTANATADLATAKQTIAGASAAGDGSDDRPVLARPSTRRSGRAVLRVGERADMLAAGGLRPGRHQQAQGMVG
jgi:hypothetical protein